MDFIKSYKLEKNNNDYTLILYLNIGLTEFANEFGTNEEEQSKNLNNYIKEFIKNNFSDIKISSVKLMVGSAVIATITLQGIVGKTEGMLSSSKNSFHMSYAYFEGGNALIDTINNTGKILDVVSPSYFDLNSDGSLKLTPHFDSNTISQLQKRNIKVVPFLSNHWNRDVGRAALNNRKSLIKEIVDVIEEYSLDGINVDIENITHEDKENFTQFIKELRESLPKDKELSIAVAANPKGYTSGWHGAYDNEKLAQYADYLMIMSYDEHYEGGNPGPISSIQFAEESIKHELKNVPSKKIVLGLPFFGRYWKDDGSIKGKGISLIKVNELINKYNGTVTFDDYTKSPKATINITGYEAEMPKGKYTIWFENEESILNKLGLIEKYNIKGAGSWSLHQATQNIWNIYNNWANGSSIFIDVEEGWAKAPILAISEKGWMIGTRDFYFEPNKPLTRAQAATLLVRVLELKGTGNNLPKFTDVPNNHWAKSDIEIASTHGLMNGKGNQKFAPDEFLTREEMATLLSRLLKIAPEAKKDNPFSDISSTQWSYPYIVSMAEEKIFEGFEDNTFRPKDKVTRAQMAALLDRIKDKLTK